MCWFKRIIAVSKLVHARLHIGCLCTGKDTIRKVRVDIEITHKGDDASSAIGWQCTRSLYTWNLAHQASCAGRLMLIFVTLGERRPPPSRPFTALVLFQKEMTCLVSRCGRPSVGTSAIPSNSAHFRPSARTIYPLRVPEQA